MYKRFKIPYTDRGYNIKNRRHTVDLNHPNIIWYRYWTAEDIMDQIEEYLWNENTPFDRNQFESDLYLQRLFLDEMTDVLSDYPDVDCDTVLEAMEHALDGMVASVRTGVRAIAEGKVAVNEQSKVRNLDDWLELQIGTGFNTVWSNGQDYHSKVLYEDKDHVFFGEVNELLSKYVKPYLLTSIYPIDTRIAAYRTVVLFQNEDIWD